MKTTDEGLKSSESGDFKTAERHNADGPKGNSMSFAQLMYADMAADQRAAAANQRATQELRGAEHAHGRSIALLVTALAELRRTDPTNPIFIPQVQQRIQAVGGWTIDRSSGFQSCWDLKLDPAEILTVVSKEHEAAKAKTASALEAASVVTKRRFWRPWKTYGLVFKTKFPTVEAASVALGRAREAARRAQLGDELNVIRLLRL